MLVPYSDLKEAWWFRSLLCWPAFDNQKTVFDLIPAQEKILAKLAKDHYFTKIDLSKGYWQIPTAENSERYTAFVTLDSLYSFRKTPFGLVSAPATFIRIMKTEWTNQCWQLYWRYFDLYYWDLGRTSKSWKRFLDGLKKLISQLDLKMFCWVWGNWNPRSCLGS